MTNYDSHSYLKQLFNRKDSSVPLETIPNTDERFISITYGRLRITDSMKFMKMNIDTIVKALSLGDFIHNKKHLDKLNILTKKLAKPYEYFKKLSDY